MQLGVSIPYMRDPDARDPLRRVFALAEMAEDAGFDFLSMGQHVFTPDYPTSSPLTILAAIAARTSRIRIASVITLLPLYHPVAIADQVATLDLISGGRAIFGIGVGYRPYEFEGFGVDVHQRGARTDEAMAAIRGAWTTGKFNFQGKHFQIPELPAVPRPVSQPHPPMWVGGVSQAALRRAAELGDGWVTSNMGTIADISAMADTYRALCDMAGKVPFVCVSRDSWVGRSREEMVGGWYRDIIARHLSLRGMGLSNDDPTGIYARLERGETVEPEEFLADRAIGGAPEACVSYIERWEREAGAQALLLLTNKKSSFEELAAQIRLWGSDVLPAARRRLSRIPGAVGD